MDRYMPFEETYSQYYALASMGAIVSAAPYCAKGEHTVRTQIQTHDRGWKY